MKKIGFSVAKKIVLRCLADGNYQHEQRDDIDVKNLLATGDIDAETIILAIKNSTGTNHTSSPHHQDSETEVHIIKSKNGWYIKFYFDDTQEDEATAFISVHR